MNRLPTDRKEIIANLGFRQEAMVGLLEYLDLLWRANDELNLLSRQMTFSDLIDNHVIDCLLPLQFFPEKLLSQVADFGSGGALPGVIYALQFPQIHFHLFEKNPRKQEFYANACKSRPRWKSAVRFRKNARKSILSWLGVLNPWMLFSMSVESMPDNRENISSPIKS